MSADQIIPELSTVVLRHSLAGLPEGQQGTVIHAWGDDRQHYLVEFNEPKALVVEVERDDIQVIASFA